MMFTRSALLLLFLGLAGCSAPRVLEPADRAPDTALDPTLIRDAVPRPSVIGRAGNKSPYQVLGRTYHVLPTAAGYRSEGVASWYGQKFHGRRTANGEIYNLYGMSAAHRSLPIPCYVRVTNLENGRSAIVRVNDRGPFHDERVIDLSYAAAVKLGYAEKGTANVAIEVIDPDNALAAEHYVQLGAFSQPELAERLRRRAESVVSEPVTISVLESTPMFYRVRVGPLPSREQAELLSERLVAERFARPNIVVE